MTVSVQQPDYQSVKKVPSYSLDVGEEYPNNDPNRSNITYNRYNHNLSFLLSYLLMKNVN